MKTLLCLIEKELIEYRIVLKLPFVIALFAVLNFALVASGDNVSFTVQTSAMGGFAFDVASTAYAGLIGKLNEMISGLVFLVLFMVYIPKTLRKERQEGSLMFWRLVPVSDQFAIVAKLLFALVIIPLITSVLLLFSDAIVWLLAKWLMTDEVMASFSVTMPAMLWHWLGFIGRLAVISLSLLPIACVLLVISQLTNHPLITAIVAVIVLKLTTYIVFDTSIISDFLSGIYSLPVMILKSEVPLQTYLSLGVLTQTGLLLMSGGLFFLCSKLRSSDDLSLSD
ncbi:ABC transporter [uncultured Photobacterium sp.]|uniref:ABC transporter n=1 Tax=uncultured Photobacterium sp. TaxID=173973 RepID=UPI0026219C9D|nr:ABC transporter [uncultured Photobacterium sp.]